MDGIVHIAGNETIDVLLAGKTYTLSTKTLRQYAEIEAFILSRRPDVYLTALEWFSGLPDSQRGGPEIRNIVESAMRVGSRARFATSDELRDYNESISGQSHRLWMAIRKHHPGVSIGDAVEVIVSLQPDDWDRLNAAFDVREQRDLIKNSSGPAASESRAEDQPAA